MPVETDAVIIGAGPVGLFQAFQLGLQGIHAHIVDALPYAGGQCVALYADKPIYDIPGIPLCTGRELVSRLQTQLTPFAPNFHLGRMVSTLEPQSDGRFLLRGVTAQHDPTLAPIELLTKTVVIAAGVGAFQPRTLALADTANLNAHLIDYAYTQETAPKGGHCVVSGDSTQALEAALDLARRNERLPEAEKCSVTLVHRRDSLGADADTVAAFRAQVARKALNFVVGQITAVHAHEGALESLSVLRGDGETFALPCEQLWVLQGLSPKLGPIAHWGLAMERRQLPVNTEDFSTTVPGIFAVGDINSYPGKKKLIVCGFHECVLAAFGAVAHIRPEESAPLLYTTTSSRLHRLLGVSHPDASLN